MISLLLFMKTLTCEYFFAALTYYVHPPPPIHILYVIVLTSMLFPLRIIGTPGRLMHVIKEMNLKLQNLEYVVFDEADR